MADAAIQVASAPATSTEPAAASPSPRSDVAADTPAALSAPSAPLFKKKSHKQTALRKPLASAVKDEEVADDKEAETVDKALEETRLLQKFRAKHHSAAVNSNIEALMADTSDDPHSHSATATKLTTIGATFQAEEETEDVVEEKMRQYIDEQLDKRRRDSNTAKRSRDDTQYSEQSASSTTTDSTVQQSGEEAALLDVTPLLRRKAVLDEKDEESAERWLRGIAEVQLPMEHRMHNVERTETARARITHSYSSAAPQLPSALPANFNSNFAMHKQEVTRTHTHRHTYHQYTQPFACHSFSLTLFPSVSLCCVTLQWDSAMRQQWKQHTEAMERHRDEQRAKGIKVEEPKERGRGRGRGGGGHGPDAASDSRVVDRFIKRFKAK